MFDKLKNFVLFIGYGRSGHTLIGALLDAHPNAIISNELNISDSFYEYENKEDLFTDIISTSKREKEMPGGRAERIKYPARQEIKYSYNVPNQYQGKYTELQIIGDKKGDNLCYDFNMNPKIFKDIGSLTKLPIKLIHVIRNPYDNIATIGIERIRVYFNLVETVGYIKKYLNYPILDIYHEDLINNPNMVLQEMANFLDLEPYKDWIKDCSSIIFDKPNKSRNKVTWTQKQVDMIEGLIKNNDFLNRYRYGLAK